MLRTKSRAREIAFYKSLERHTLKECAGEHCNEMFRPYSSRHIFHHPTCNPDYRAHGYEPKLTNDKQCKQCNKTFPSCRDREVFCSDQCKLDWYDERRVPDEERPCGYSKCGKTFKGKGTRKYCGDACAVEAKRERELGRYA